MSEVSVIIPVYNVENFLGECLDSVVNQSFKDLEIICVDDGSTDGSQKLLAEYAKKDARIKIICAEHSNAGAARNIGYRASSGKYLLFLDADDVFAPRMIETLHGAIIKYGVDFANCAKRDFMSGSALPTLADGDVENFKVIDNSRREVNCFREFVGWSWDKLFSRSLAEKYQLEFQEQQAHNDFFFCNCYCCLSTKFAKTDDVFIAHRKHETSIAVNRDKSPLCFSSALRGFYRKLESLGYWKQFPKQLRFYNNYVVELGFWTIDTLKKRESIELAYRELRTMLIEQNALDKDKYYMDVYPQWFSRYKVLCKDEDALLFWRDAEIEERKSVKWLQGKFNALKAEYDGFTRSVKENEYILSKQIAKLNSEKEVASNEIRALKGSFAYRVGMVVTWPARSVARLFGVKG